jgi:thiomorpholine-carboxylate dehydrogenase
VAASVEEAVGDASVVITVTSSAEPILRGEWLAPGAYVNAVGAVGPDRRELDDCAMQARVVVESREAAMTESGDIILSGASVYAEIGELLGRSAAPEPGGRFVFKSLGIAAEDIAAAWLVLNSLLVLKSL